MWSSLGEEDHWGLLYTCYSSRCPRRCILTDICEWGVGSGVACDCMYAHTCVGLSAPSAAESLVYSNSMLGPKLPLCWPPKPACLFQPFWPPVSKLGGGGTLLFPG